jgi:anti-sigma factor ChrR (cupin superfamily)
VKTPGANVKQIELKKAVVPGSNYEVSFDVLEISPGAVARHTHPGPTLVYVLEGGFTLLMGGYVDGSTKRQSRNAKNGTTALS